jgi:hypothetical protein
VTISELERAQRASLRVAPTRVLATATDAELLLHDLGFVLRYHGKGVPIASLRSACGPEGSEAALIRSITLSNHLLGTKQAIEVLVIAGRVALVHRTLMPALYVLVRRGRPVGNVDELSLPARQALHLINQQREVTVGDVRGHLSVKAETRHDPASDALSELQRALLVDRGPFEMPTHGVPYLSRDGYPYHLFHHAHADLVKSADGLSINTATDTFVRTYLRAAVFATPRKLLSLFKLFLTKEDIGASLDRLVHSRAVTMEKVGRETVAIATTPRETV